MDEQKEEIVILFYDKDTNEYKRFEKYYIEKSKVVKYLDKYNSENDKNEYAEINQDKLILKIIDDIGNTIQYKNFKTSLHDIINELDDRIDELDDRIDELRYAKDESEKLLEEQE